MSDLHVLIIDDSPDDADLLRRELIRGGYELHSERVDTGADLAAALGDHQWDIVLSDWSMPGFTAEDAIDIFKQHELDIPFIIVSGSIAEEFVVKAMKSGAHDFFSKDRLTLLAPAVDRELREASGRRERAQMQEQLTISDRMASVGILAAGVAHEINNPLAAVVGNLTLACASLRKLVSTHGEMAELKEILAETREAHQAAERIRNVAADLKLLSRSDDDSCEAIDLREVIESSIRMAQHEIRHRAQLRTDFHPIPRVAGNESRLGQVVLNLIVNAAQSITDGGMEDNEIFLSTELAANGDVVFTIRDTGSGLSEEVKRKLFSPFFTTKPIGVGTGLGLSICHRIVTEMGGTITAEGEVGKGAEFKVRLVAFSAPDATSPATEHSEGQAAEEQGPGRRGAILVIDDEASIGVLLQRVLGDHDVAMTMDAAEALEWISSGTAYDVIFCDLMMPVLTGMEFYGRLEQIDPSQTDKVIFLTGGTFTLEARRFLECVDNSRVDKPFDVDDIRHLVRARVGV